MRLKQTGIAAGRRWPAANGVSRRPLLKPFARRPTLRTQEMRRTRALRRVFLKFSAAYASPKSDRDAHDHGQPFLSAMLSAPKEPASQPLFMMPSSFSKPANAAKSNQLLGFKLLLTESRLFCLDHDDFGSTRPKIIVIDSHNLERDFSEKAFILHEGNDARSR